jgi:glycine/D-amino acid oxidase-like deaminating enzyme
LSNPDHTVGSLQAEAGSLMPAPRPRLTFDLDVDVCVVGAGLAGLTAAREIARLGATVVVLEGRQVGWNASGHQFGAVMPGFGNPVAELIARVGFDDAREMWSLAQAGVDYVASAVADSGHPDLLQGSGALEVSTVDSGDELISRLQTLGEDFGTPVEGWQIEQVRAALKTPRYFHAVHYSGALQVDGRRYVHAMARMAEAAGARIFEETPVIGLDPAGIRKRIATPVARVRASQIVLAGGVHLGAPLQRLSDTLLPVWRQVAITAPLGERLAACIGYAGTVRDTAGLTMYRIVDGDRLMWTGGDTSLRMSSRRFARSVRRQLATLFPQLGPVEIAEVFGGVVGETVHGMPQVGEMRRGVWVASGFGRQGLNTSAMAGQLIARGSQLGDDRWRLFSPFELVWAGGRGGRVVNEAILSWTRGRTAAAGALARFRERARERERAAAARIAANAARRQRPITDIRTPPGPEARRPRPVARGEPPARSEQAGGE